MWNKYTDLTLLVRCWIVKTPWTRLDLNCDLRCTSQCLRSDLTASGRVASKLQNTKTGFVSFDEGKPLLQSQVVIRIFIIFFQMILLGSASVVM